MIADVVDAVLMGTFRRRSETGSVLSTLSRQTGRLQSGDSVTGRLPPASSRLNIGQLDVTAQHNEGVLDQIKSIEFLLVL